MADLVAMTPLDGLLPLRIGALDLSEVDPGPISFIQPARGQAAAVSNALEEQFGVGLPAPGRVTQGDGMRLLWFGPGQALLLGATVELEAAMIVDQSDGWAVARVDGPDARDVLARLTPLDTRASVFAEGQTARTLIGHMTGQITPVGPDAFELMVFRSMAGTLVHDLTRAAGFVAGRAALR